VLQVRLFGTFRVLLNGSPIHFDLGRSGSNMASFLFAFSGRAHRRERLADLFWPELEPERSRAALNSALWRLRKAISREPASSGGGNVITHGSDIILEPKDWLEIDTRLFEANVNQLMKCAHSLVDAPLQKELHQHLNQYVGPFLDGEDADWILEERERLHSLFVGAATALARCYGHESSYEDGIALIRKVLAFDPYRESALRSLLVLLSLNDQRAEAIQVYNRWKTSLKCELGVDPMPATVQLVNDLRVCQTDEEFDVIKDRLFGVSQPIARFPRDE
jgi:DNA-binding SARP family transcriptional activator